MNGEELSGKAFTGWRPYAYVADILGTRTYDGNMEPKQTAIQAHPSNLTGQGLNWSSNSNFKVSGFQGRLLRVNSNARDASKLIILNDLSKNEHDVELRISKDSIDWLSEEFIIYMARIKTGSIINDEQSRRTH